MIGGEQIYLLALPLATRCEVTEVDIDLPRDDDDALAPVLDEAWLGVTGEWQVSRTGLRYRFHTLQSAVSAAVPGPTASPDILGTRGRSHGSTKRFQKGELAVITEPAKTFSRMFRGYEPAAVDAHIEMLTTKQQLLLNDVESLEARLTESGDEAAALRKEVAVLTDTSPSPHAMQQRMAKMLRRAVDEVSEMQAEARAEAEALIAAAEAEAEATRRKHEELLADMATQRKALEVEYDETKKKLDAELAGMRAETQSAIDEAWRDARREADHYRDQARRAVDEASQQRIKILEQLMGVYRDLETVPAALESAYQEQKNSPEASVVVPSLGLSSGSLAAEGGRKDRYSRRRVDAEPYVDRRAGSADSRCGPRV